MNARRIVRIPGLEGNDYISNPDTIALKWGVYAIKSKNTLKNMPIYDLVIGSDDHNVVGKAFPSVNSKGYHGHIAALKN